MSVPPTTSLAIVGPGRAGQALARRWLENGVPVEGFVGHTVQGAGAAVRFAGGGRVLDRDDLQGCAVVMLAVQDDRLGAVAADFAGRQLARPGQLWFHCSGAHDLQVLDSLRIAGARCGSLHPLCPIPDPQVGYENLPGKPAIVQVHAGDADSAGQLMELARAAGLEPHRMDGGDRLLYHAACVLAANGLTALYSIVEAVFARALPGAEVGAIPAALMRGALDACVQHGAVDALSGPVPRGDAGLIGRQRAALAALDSAPETAVVFRALLTRAAHMAEARGVLSGEPLAAVHAALADGAPAGGAHTGVTDPGGDA